MAGNAFLCYLIPWPGPHWMPCMETWVDPGPMEMQSSPVPILELVILTKWDDWMWIPSVLGLLASAETLTPSMFTLLQLLITIWNFWLFIDVKPLILMLFDPLNNKVCKNIWQNFINKKTACISRKFVVSCGWSKPWHR